MASVLAGKRSNYDTELFTPIFAELLRITPGLKPYSGKVGRRANLRGMSDVGQILATFLARVFLDSNSFDALTDQPST